MIKVCVLGKVQKSTVVLSLSPTPNPTPSFQNNQDDFGLVTTSKSLIKTSKSELTSVTKNEITPPLFSKYKIYIHRTICLKHLFRFIYFISMLY